VRPTVSIPNFCRRLVPRWLTAGTVFILLAGPIEAVPPSQEYQLNAVTLASAHVVDLKGKDYSSKAQEMSAGFLARTPLIAPSFYLGVGLRAENYYFSEAVSTLHRLQDYAAVLSVEYFSGEENAAALTLRPGWYFGGRPRATAWDVPVELTAGLPISSNLDGVLGFSNSRFYHHALPILGFVFKVTPRLRVEAVYPEPALVFIINPKTTLRIGGELTGAGFLADAGARSTVVEYASYRLGVELSGEWRRGIDYAVGTGYEAERSFDFFRSLGRLHGHGAAYIRLRLIRSKNSH
jgi:hypothetical protein